MLGETIHHRATRRSSMPDTRFHETVHRWKQPTRRYELAVVIAVLLFAWVALPVTFPVRDPPDHAKNVLSERAEEDRQAEELLAEKEKTLEFVRETDRLRAQDRERACEIAGERIRRQLMAKRLGLTLEKMDELIE
jgi:flagellar biosynthesis/type III secretory pathway M-ring protein FliF/YscJ